MNARTTLRQSDPKPDSLAEAKRKAQLIITCPSDTTYELRAVTLDDLVAAGDLPDNLLRIALLENHQPGGVSADIARDVKKGNLESARVLSAELVQVRDRIVMAALVYQKPTTLKDVQALDQYDRQMIAEFAQRRRAVDWAGKKVGADTLDTFRRACTKLALVADSPESKDLLLQLAELQ